jgi:ribonuclease HII
VSTARGQQAELAAAAFLEYHGCTVIARNWRTRWCEIDIIAQRDGVIYFVEVKYRSSNAWGSGLDYITPKKLQQMQFAAEFWRARHGALGQCKIAAAELTGDPPKVTGWVRDVG